MMKTSQAKKSIGLDGPLIQIRTKEQAGIKSYQI